ncbi:MAG: hypothetical protein VKK04_23610 [Synechococcales bacterium]|nr:hypothetical protein [Synechococcales bacterium]
MGAPGFTITIDYRFAGSEFDAQAKQRIEEAARIWESLIADDFEDVAAGTPIHISNPVTDADEIILLDRDVDDLIIFVGAQSLGENGPAAYATSSYTFSDPALEARHEGADFEPAAGSITFNSDFNPGFANLGLVIHEMGHVLGIGIAPVFAQKSASGSFDGPTVRAINNGNPIALSEDLGHLDPFFRLSNGLRPVVGGGIGSGLPTVADLAMLADIGYEIPALASVAVGQPLPVLNYTLNGSDGEDFLSGYDGDDIILGGKGDDFLQGEVDDLLPGSRKGSDRLDGGEGNDSLEGGSGDDLITGGAGDDTLYGGQYNASTGGDRDTFFFDVNSGKDQIRDFEADYDVIQIAPGYGITSVSSLLDGLTVLGTFSDGRTASELVLSPGNTITIAHDKPLTAVNFQIDALPDLPSDPSSGNPSPNPPAPFQGTDENDTMQGEDGVDDLLMGGKGNDRLRGGSGGDRLVGGSGNDALFGQDNDDTLLGGKGKDRLFGDAGNDILKGGGDNDTLRGGTGDDLLVGGAGGDRYILKSGEGFDTIRGFSLKQDRLIFKGISSSQLTFIQEGGDVLIRAGESDLALVQNQAADKLESRFG